MVKRTAAKPTAAQPARKLNSQITLNTNKGSFKFTKVQWCPALAGAYAPLTHSLFLSHPPSHSLSLSQVADGLFVQHEWGANSGQIGIPTDSLLQFSAILSGFAAGNSATPAVKKTAVAKPAVKPKGIAKKESRKEKKPPAPKPTVEVLPCVLPIEIACYSFNVCD